MTTDEEFNILLQKTLRYEGFSEFTDDPLDHGGATKWGVIQATALHYYPDIDVRNLTFAQAAHIYRVGYFDWIPPEIIDIKIAWVLFDAGVNCGAGRSCKFLQRVLTVPETGEADPATIDALFSYQAEDGWQKSLFDALETLRAVYYRAIVDRDPTQKKFLAGWLRRAGDLCQDLPAA